MAEVHRLVAPVCIGIVLGVVLIFVLGANTQPAGNIVAHKKDDDAHVDEDLQQASLDDESVAKLARITQRLKEKLPSMDINADTIAAAVREANAVGAMPDDMSWVRMLDRGISMAMLCAGLWALDQVLQGGLSQFATAMFPRETELLFGKR